MHLNSNVDIYTQRSLANTDAWALWVLSLSFILFVITLVSGERMPLCCLFFIMNMNGLACRIETSAINDADFVPFGAERGLVTLLRSPP